MIKNPRADLKQILTGHKAYFALMGLLLLVCFYTTAHFENRKIWGDEGHYISATHKLPSTVTNFLPGGMTYDWWPPFAFSFYTALRTAELNIYYQKHFHPERNTLDANHREFLKRVGAANILLLAVACTATYIIAILTGLPSNWAAISAGLFSLNPRVLFYLQALWPEILHMALMTSATLSFLLFLRCKKHRYLIISSILFGYCVLTKGVVGLYFLLLAPLLVWQVYRSFSPRSTLVALLAFLLPYLAVSHAQKASNLIIHDDYAISSNTWINIEAGLISQEHAIDEGYKNVFDRYYRASENRRVREKLSQERVIAFLKTQPLEKIIRHQLNNYRDLMNQAFVNRGVEAKRWKRSRQLTGLDGISTPLSWFLLILGFAGALRFLRLNQYTTAPAIFLLYYLPAMIIVGFNPRLFVPAIPFLAIFTTLLLWHGFIYLSQHSALKKLRERTKQAAYPTKP